MAGTALPEVETAGLNLRNALEDRGLRRTAARVAVTGRIGALEGAFTVEQLCRDVPGVGRATVYRTVRHLVDAGALCKVAMPDGTPTYSVARVEHHHHTICTGCGAVGEFRHSTVERVMRSLAKEIDGEIVGHRMEVYITCKSCLTGAATGKPNPDV